MEFTPPINERNDKELFNIISNKEKWSYEIQIIAEQELLRRNYSQSQIAKQKNRRIKILNVFNERKRTIIEKNKNESYTAIEMILIVLFFPLSFFLKIFFGHTFLYTFGELNAKNYRKKIWQRIVLIIFSIFLWFQILKTIDP